MTLAAEVAQMSGDGRLLAETSAAAQALVSLGLVRMDPVGRGAATGDWLLGVV